MNESVVGTLETVSQPVSLDECRQWWNEAVEKLVLTKKMADLGFAPYDPMPERILRLICDRTRQSPEYQELAHEPAPAAAQEETADATN